MNAIAKGQKPKVVGQRPPRPDGVEKVTGRATFGADFFLPGMLVGRVKRSPHAHARIVKIDTRAAQALPGVKAIMTAKDFPLLKNVTADGGEATVDYGHVSDNVMAREKALYVGHAVAAVAAVSPEIAEEAVRLIEVTYEKLPHVIEVEAAMAPDAPLLHDDLRTKGVTPPPAPSNVAHKHALGRGDVAGAMAKADVIIEARYVSAATHQGYIEPHACVASCTPDGQATIWVSTQGQFAVRAFVSKIAGAPLRDLKVIPAEIGGGFGGKTVVYLEPLAYLLSKKSGRRGENGHEPRRSVRGLRPNLGLRLLCEDWRQEGRHDHRRRSHDEVPGRRLSGLAGWRGMHDVAGLLRRRERLYRRL